MRCPRLVPWFALVLAGAASVFLCASSVMTVTGPGLPPRSGAALALVDGAAVEWTFTTDRQGLRSLRLWLAAPPPPGAELGVSLALSTAPQILLVDGVAALAAAAPDGAINVSFEPMWVRQSPHVPTATLVVRLSPRGLMPGAPLMLSAGDALGQGEAIPAFIPGYAVRPLDVLWPISALAEGRPGLLGWPPFYALLAYSFLVLLVRSLWRVARPLAERELPTRD